ncbi:MAG: hypothetical protein QM661_04645 [Solimonas sp.]
MNVSIRGHGVAALCCARLLSRAGFVAQRQVAVRTAAVPAILLGAAGLALLRDVLGLPALFADRPRVIRRMVSWGGGDPVAFPHDAVVVSGDELDAALRADIAPASESTADLTIHTAAPFPAGGLRHFGARRGQVARVAYLHEEDAMSCWMEAVAAGWLFCIPAGTGAGWLLAVGATPESLLGQSRHLGSRIALLPDASPAAGVAGFDTHPRILDALQGPDWLACGTAAVAFDPICGDGTAQAVREAILAAAAVAAIRDGQPAEAVRLHHESMLIAAMRRHLKLCGEFYLKGGKGEWWQAQLAALVEGHDWCSRRLAPRPPPRYALQGYRLVPCEKAA